MMSDDIQHANPEGHGDYERRDIGAAGVLYFLAALALGGVITHFVVSGVFHVLETRTEKQQTTMSPLMTSVPEDTRHLPPEYKTDAESTNYEKYLLKNFPAPQLETDERDQLDKVRLNEEQILNSYGYVDQSAGTVRIPIDRAMDLIAQRGLPVRGQGNAMQSPPAAGGANATKGRKK